MKKILPGFVAILLLISCRTIPDLNSVLDELRDKYGEVKYAVYSYSIAETDTENYQAIIWESQGEKISLLQSKKVSGIGIITNEWLFAPTYGLILTKIDGKRQGEILERKGDKYETIYKMETAPTEIVERYKQKNAEITMLEDKKIAEFDTYVIEITNKYIPNNKTDTPWRLVLAYDRKTGFLISEDRYDSDGNLIFSYKLNSLDRKNDNTVWRYVDFANIDEVKKMMEQISIK